MLDATHLGNVDRIRQKKPLIGKVGLIMIKITLHNIKFTC